MAGLDASGTTSDQGSPSGQLSVSPRSIAPPRRLILWQAALLRLFKGQGGKLNDERMPNMTLMGPQSGKGGDLSPDQRREGARKSVARFGSARRSGGEQRLIEKVE